jgi:hypothetical protein
MPHKDRAKRKAYETAYYARNHAALSAKGKVKRANTKDKIWAYQLMYHFGLTVADYAGLMEKQAGVCACCKHPETAIHNITRLPKRLAVDHDHAKEYAPGRCRKEAVRGLLCQRCNCIAGYARDSVEVLLGVALYLEATK